jgi:hypothetical protein
VPRNVAIAPAALVDDLDHDRGQVHGALGQPEGASRDGRDERDLVALGERLSWLRVLAVHGIEQAGRLVTKPERWPHILENRPVSENDLAPISACLLAKPGEQPDDHSHGRSVD